MCYKPVYRVRWLKNKAAILIIVWTYLITTVYHLLRSGYINHPQHNSISVMGITLIAAALLYPVGGWLADTYFGRYKTIQFSMWAMWITTLFMTVNELVADGNAFYRGHVHQPIRYTLSLILATGFGGFLSNIVQLGIDQLTDASTTEITSFITWYTLILYISGVTLQYATYCTINSFYVRTFAVTLFLSVALCLDSLFNHWLIKENANRTSLNLVYKVVKFLIKYKHGLVINSEGTVSRFDAAKHMYGGPFTNQQVEDVKSILHIILLIAVCTTVIGGIAPIEYATEKLQHTMQGWSHKHGIIDCYERLSIWYNDYWFVIALVTLHEFIIYPLHIRCFAKIKITSRFLLGTVLFLLHILALLMIEITTSYYGETKSNTNSTKCIFTADDKNEMTLVNYKWLLAPGFMRGLSIFLFFTSGIEFIWAQTPYYMTGLALGTMYAFLGLNTTIQALIASPFLFFKIPWKNVPLTCGIWYFLLQGALMAIFLIVGIITVSKYKRRERNDSSLKSYTESVNNY